MLEDADDLEDLELIDFAQDDIDSSSGTIPRNAASDFGRPRS